MQRVQDREIRQNDRPDMRASECYSPNEKENMKTPSNLAPRRKDFSLIHLGLNKIDNKTVADSKNWTLLTTLLIKRPDL